MFPTNVCFENYNKKDRSLTMCFFGAVMGQTCPIYACTGTYHAHHFFGSWYILLQLKARVFKATLEEKLTGRKS